MKQGRYFKVYLDGKYYATTGANKLVLLLAKYGEKRITYKTKTLA